MIPAVKTQKTNVGINEQQLKRDSALGKNVYSTTKEQKSGNTCRNRLSIPGDGSDAELPSKRAKVSESTSSHKCGSNYGLKKMTALLRISKADMMSLENTPLSK